MSVENSFWARVKAFHEFHWWHRDGVEIARSKCGLMTVPSNLVVLEPNLGTEEYCEACQRELRREHPSRSVAA
jgi:hypothetical protein